MAKINFFKIKIKNENNDIIENINLVDKFEHILNQMSDEEKYCKNRNCDSIIGNYIVNKKKINEYSITCDFIKFTEELINSAIVSDPSSDTDTLKELNNKTIELSKYTDKDVKKIKNIVELKNQTIKNAKSSLEKVNINRFVIYKILLDNKIDLIEDNEKLSESFYKTNLERLKKTNTFFNISYYKNKNILMLQQVSGGFDYEQLEKYINTYVLKNENIKISISYLYDEDFMNILEKSDLKSFEFTFNLKEKSLLENKDFVHPFKFIYTLLGGNNITINSNAEKDHTLNNKKLFEFFNLAIETGLISVAKVKKNGSRHFIKSTSKGGYLYDTTNIKVETLHTANEVIIEAFLKKSDIICNIIDEERF